MITRMTGTLTRVLDEEVRLQIGPLEYQLLVPEAVRRLIQLRSGGEITFHVTEYLESTSGGNRFIPRRIGFTTEAELEFFELFCTVEKIGVKKALKAMARSVKDIADAIGRQDVKWLSTLPGIGATTAEQIVASLKRKVAKFAMTTDTGAAESTASGTKSTAASTAAVAGSPEAVGKLIEEVYEALMGLGHSPMEARSKLDGLLTCGKPFASLQEALMLIYAQKV